MKLEKTLFYDPYGMDLDNNHQLKLKPVGVFDKLTKPEPT